MIGAMTDASLLPPPARIALVTPAGRPDPAGLADGVALLTGWGYEVVPAPHLGARHRYLAGTVEERSADLAWALTAPDIDAVWMGRGGFGSAHCLPFLPRLDGPPRLLIGCSDATALLVALSGEDGVLGVHGPTVEKLASTDEATQRAVGDLLLHGGPVELSGRLVLGSDAEIDGPVLGGNLCMLASLAGTPWQLAAAGSLLVLEDVAEPAYKLDRMITQLRAAGCLDGVRAVLLGEFLKCPVPEGADYTVEEILVDLLSPLGVPIVIGLPVGHGTANHPWYYGGHGRLADGVLKISPPPCHVGASTRTQLL